MSCFILDIFTIKIKLSTFLPPKFSEVGEYPKSFGRSSSSAESVDHPFPNAQQNFVAEKNTSTEKDILGWLACPYGGHKIIVMEIESSGMMPAANHKWVRQTDRQTDSSQNRAGGIKPKFH